MPQLLFLAAVGAGIYAGIRAIKAVVETMAPEEVKAAVRQRQRGSEPKNLGTLDYDPVNGVYRPRD